MADKTPIHVGYIDGKDDADRLPVYRCPIDGVLVVTPEIHEAWHESMRWS